MIPVGQLTHQGGRTSARLAGPDMRTANIAR